MAMYQVEKYYCHGKKRMAMVLNFVDMINMKAIMAYREQGTEEKIKNALDCLIERCGIDGSSQ